MRSGSRSWPPHVRRSSSGSGAGVVHHYTALEGRHRFPAMSVVNFVVALSVPTLTRRRDNARFRPGAADGIARRLRRFDFRRVATGGRGLGRH